ncbi:hypothetical protein ACLOJK_015048 [Asimina triloba]
MDDHHAHSSLARRQICPFRPTHPAPVSNRRPPAKPTINHRRPHQLPNPAALLHATDDDSMPTPPSAYEPADAHEHPSTPLPSSNCPMRQQHP